MSVKAFKMSLVLLLSAAVVLPSITYALSEELPDDKAEGRSLDEEKCTTGKCFKQVASKPAFWERSPSETEKVVADIYKKDKSQGSSESTK